MMASVKDKTITRREQRHFLTLIYSTVAFEARYLINSSALSVYLYYKLITSLTRAAHGGLVRPVSMHVS